MPVPDPDRFAAAPFLQGLLATLEPLATEHVDDLSAAIVEEDLFKVWYTRLPSPDDMGAEIDRRLRRQAEGVIAAWTIRRNSDGRAVGMTTFLNLRPDHRRLELGSTWISVSAQGAGINAEAELLQLRRAFDDLDCIAVEFRTHWHNRQSRAAIAALGAKQDGVLRNHDLWRDGTMRDVVVFSIIASEWPTVRLDLQQRLARRA